MGNVTLSGHAEVKRSNWKQPITHATYLNEGNAEVIRAMIIHQRILRATKKMLWITRISYILKENLYLKKKSNIKKFPKKYKNTVRDNDIL